MLGRISNKVKMSLKGRSRRAEESYLSNPESQCMMLSAN